MSETSLKYQKRMVAAYTLIAKIEEVKAAVFELTSHAHDWDNQHQVNEVLWGPVGLFSKCDEARDALIHATNVAHYG